MKRSLFFARAGVSPPTTSRGKPLQPVQHQPLLHAATFVKFHRQPENLKWRLKNVLTSLKLATLVFRLPLFTVSTADGASAARRHLAGKRCAMPNSTRDMATSRRRSICAVLNSVSGCLNLRHRVYSNHLRQSFNQHCSCEIGSLKWGMGVGRIGLNGFSGCLCLFYQQPDKWSVGGSPTLLWTTTRNAKFNLRYGDEPSPLHLRHAKQHFRLPQSAPSCLQQSFAAIV